MPILYLDESGFASSMPRRYGYALKGRRCYGTHDWQAKGRINVIGAIINHQFITADLYESNINSDIFYEWVKNVLLPKLKYCTVIVMDNARFHKRKDIIELIEKKRHVILWLPEYSPDLNPIEHKWAEVKQIRKATGCSVSELF